MTEAFRILIEGKDALQAAEHLQKVVKEVFGGDPELRGDGQGQERADDLRGWKEDLALLLAIPSALVSTIDLASRPVVVEQVSHVLEAARELKNQFPDLEIHVGVSGDFIVDIHKAHPVDVTNELARRQSKGRGAK